MENHNCMKNTEIELIKYNQNSINSSLDKVNETLEKFNQKFDLIMKNSEGQIRIEEKLSFLDKDIQSLNKNFEESIKYRQKVDNLTEDIQRMKDESSKIRFYILSLFATILIFILTFSFNKIFEISSSSNNKEISSK